MATQLSEKKVKALVREGVREALRTEMMKLRAILMPLVSAVEQRDVERRFKAPSGRAATIHTVKI